MIITLIRPTLYFADIFTQSKLRKKLDSDLDLEKRQQYRKYTQHYKNYATN